MPIVEALQKHHQQQTVSFHVPGHKNGFLFDGMPFLKTVGPYDVTEIPGLDDLHAPSSCIFEAEQLLSDLFQTTKSYFLVNGSTSGNLAAIYSLLEENEIVFVQRNSHKSVFHGIELSRAMPIYLGPEYNESLKVHTHISFDTVKEAFEQFPLCKKIILTHPDYYGNSMDLEKIIHYVHERNGIVIIDEAHGAHFIADDSFPKSALQMGADVVVQSAHKMLPALTMGGFLHVNSKTIDLHQLQRALQIFQTSSPSYLVLASLDFARFYLANYCKEDALSLHTQLNDLVEAIRQFPFIEIIPSQDPLKLILRSHLHGSGYQLKEDFEKNAIFPEFADLQQVALILPLLKKQHSFSFMKIVAAIQKLEIGNKNQPTVPVHSFKYPKISHMKKINTNKVLEVALKHSIGMVSAEKVIPYPPGIPILLEGEKITEEHRLFIQQLLNSGAHFHPSRFQNTSTLRVYESVK